MPSVWNALVPYHVVRDLIRHPKAHPVGREQRFEAVTLFADISGFTAISEALGRVGKRGSEELTLILNSYFEPMIHLIHSYGGIIGKFGGDAMTVFFPYTAASQVAVTRRAIQCALDMQARMGNYAAMATQAGVFGLTMKAGLANGPLFCTVIGDLAIRLEYIIAGRALDDAAEAEHNASSGEVVVQADLLSSAGEIECGGQRGEFCLVQRLKGWASHAPLAPVGELPARAITTLSSFVHPSIAQRLHEEQLSFLNEHRKVTVLFASFDGFDYNHDAQVGDRLQAYLSRVIYGVQRYDGYLNKVDMGDKGSKVLVLFGAPIAHENDAERALRCALELRSLKAARPGSATAPLELDVRIGIHTGFVYCGQVGSAERLEYTVMGDAVNLAARLMQAAQPGQILVSENTHLEASKPFEWESNIPLQVKGKSETVVACPLSALRLRGTMYLREPVYALPMVGRQAELEVVNERLTRVLQGQGQIIGITAEAGLGKSRLAAEVIKMSNQRGLVGIGGECPSHGTNTPYLVWQHTLRSLFELGPNLSYEEQLTHLQSRLAAVDPILPNRLPLLSVALNMSIPDNDLTRSLDARLRKESLEALLVACIRHRARATPLLILLEDCHWIDPLSNDLLEAVGRNIADVPVLLLVIYRPPEAEPIQPRVNRFGHFSEIRLSDFTPGEARRLIELKLAHLFAEAGRLPEAFIARIRERAQGNPFFLDEMINLIHDRGLDLSDVRLLETFDLPDSLHSLIVSRIDRLAEIAKTTLKVASVIGRTFKAGWLWSVYPKLGSPERVREQLAQLSRLDITPLDKSEPELEYIFKHIITRDVAYESLSLATRAMLHEQIGLFIERAFPDELKSYLDLLAYHYGLSENSAKQCQYFRRAGDAAQAAYANQAVIQYYQRLLPLLSETEQSEVMLELGKVWRVVGKWDEAEAICQQSLAISLRRDDVHTQAHCQHAIGALSRSRGDYAKALEWLNLALHSFEAVGDGQAIGETTREIGIVYWEQGDYSAALDRFARSRQIASDSGDRRNLYKAIANMGLVYWAQGDLPAGLACYEQSYAIASELGDRLWAGVIMGNMGNIYLEQDDYRQALACYTQNLTISLELGHRQGVSIAVGNLGNVYWWQGDYPSVLACQTYNLQISLELGDRLGVSLALWYMANAYQAQGDYADARRLLTQAIALGRTLDIPYELCDFLYSYADLLVRMGEAAAAQSANAEALELAAQVEQREVQFKAAMTEIRLKVLRGECTSAAAIAEFEAMLAERQDEKEQAHLHYEVWRLDPGQEAHRRQAADLYRSLYAATPNIRLKNRYEMLTGESLPPLAGLPPLPEVVTSQPANLGSLLKLVTASLAVS